MVHRSKREQQKKGAIPPDYDAIISSDEEGVAYGVGDSKSSELVDSMQQLRARLVQDQSSNSIKGKTAIRNKPKSDAGKLDSSQQASNSRANKDFDKSSEQSFGEERLKEMKAIANPFLKVLEDVRQKKAQGNLDNLPEFKAHVKSPKTAQEEKPREATPTRKTENKVNDVLATKLPKSELEATLKELRSALEASKLSNDKLNNVLEDKDKEIEFLRS